MASSSLTKALGLVDRAEKELGKIRLGTPVGYMDTDEDRGAVTEKMRWIDGEFLEQAMTLVTKMPPPERKTFIRRFGDVNRMFSYIAREAVEGRLPQFKDAPWPPYEWVVRENMRAEAAEAEAEPATNGYDQTEEGA